MWVCFVYTMIVRIIFHKDTVFNFNKTQIFLSCFFIVSNVICWKINHSSFTQLHCFLFIYQCVNYQSVGWTLFHKKHIFSTNLVSFPNFYFIFIRFFIKSFFLKYNNTKQIQEHGYPPKKIQREAKFWSRCRSCLLNKIRNKIKNIFFRTYKTVFNHVNKKVIQKFKIHFHWFFKLRCEIIYYLFISGDMCLNTFVIFSHLLNSLHVL